MGSALRKCVDCFKPKQPDSNPVHQLVNLSKNPDSSIAQVDPHVISFVNKSMDDTVVHERPKDVNDMTLETIPEKQLQGLQSPDSNGVSEHQPILSENQTNPNEEIASPVSAKEGLMVLKGVDNLEELKRVGEFLLEEFESERDAARDFEEVANTSKVGLRMFSEQQATKKYIHHVKAEFEIENATLEQYMIWSSQEENRLDDLIQDYSTKQIDENVWIAKFQTQKYVCVTPKEFQYLKFRFLRDGALWEIYRSFETQEGQQIAQGRMQKNTVDKAIVRCGGVTVEEQNQRLKCNLFLVVDLSVRLPFAMTKKAFKDKVCSLVEKLRSSLK